MSIMKNALLSLMAVAAMLMLTRVSMAQAPASPALHFSADYFSDSLSLADNTNLTGIDWVDNITGARATTFGSEMTLSLSQANGNPVVRDNGPGLGNNQWWLSDAEMLAKAPNLFSGTNDFTFFSVMRGIAPIPDINNVGITAVWGPTATHQNQWYLSAEPGSGFMRSFQAAGGGTFAALGSLGLSPADIIADFHTWGWRKSGGAAAVLESYADGNIVGVGGSTLADLGTHDQGGFGRRMNFLGGQGQFRGDLAEIIFYDRALTHSELALVDSYIHNKYVVPEPSAIGLSVMGLVVLGAYRRGRC